MERLFSRIKLTPEWRDRVATVGTGVKQGSKLGSNNGKRLDVIVRTGIGSDHAARDLQRQWEALAAEIEREDASWGF